MEMKRASKNPLWAGSMLALKQKCKMLTRKEVEEKIVSLEYCDKHLGDLTPGERSLLADLKADLADSK